MVSINNNLGDKFKIIDSKMSVDKANELFAELFALINTNYNSNEENELVSFIAENPLVNEFKKDFNEKKSLEIDINPEVIKNHSKQENKNEVELAKSLVQVFYKEFGIENTENTNKNVKKEVEASPKLSNSLAFYKSLKLEKNIEKKASSNSDLNKIEVFERNQNLEINIIKKTNIVNKNIKSLTKEKDSILFKSKEPKLNNELKSPELDLKKIPNNNISKELKTNFIEKKSKKKSKQLGNLSKENSDNNKLDKIILKEGLGLNQIKSLSKNQISSDNKINIKKEIKTNDSKLTENKLPQPNMGGKEFLDLLESSWGEKFSKIIKNSVNNNLNKVEIELRPKNLGKLNLEVVVKNNKTTINLSSENQDVVNILNDNFSKFNELIDRENKAFTSLMNNNNQNNNFNKKKNKGDFTLDHINKKKNKEISEMKKISNHNIDVNA